MKDKEKDLIIKLLKAEIAEAEHAVQHCEANGYAELRGQVERLKEVNEAYYAIILSDNTEARQ
jgi:hypothetical protein